MSESVTRGIDVFAVVANPDEATTEYVCPATVAKDAIVGTVERRSSGVLQARRYDLSNTISMKIELGDRKCFRFLREISLQKAPL